MSSSSSDTEHIVVVMNGTIYSLAVYHIVKSNEVKQTWVKPSRADRTVR